MKITIEYIINLESGELINTENILNMDRNKIFKLRRELEIGIQNKKSNYVCSICHNPVKLRAGLQRIVHFAHLKDSPDCPIKTDTNYTKEELLRIWYHGTKESLKHIKMKK